MANFQRIILMIAALIFIISLSLIAYSMHKSHNNPVWPPVVGQCPDYWIDLSGNGDNCSNVMNLGTCNLKKMNFDVAPYTGAGGACAKYKWAVGCNVTWDGITSGVQNPCDVSGNS
jgi:hypothetical protein